MDTGTLRFALEVVPRRAPDSIPDTFVPDILLPAQLAWGCRQDSHASGPRALMLALLEDAIRCLLTPRRSRHVAREAEAWIRADDPLWPMSFLNVCEALGLAPAKLRAALLAKATAGRTGEGRPGAPWTLQLRRGRERRRRICLAERWAAAS
jgi:hypothetical protein